MFPPPEQVGKEQKTDKKKDIGIKTDDVEFIRQLKDSESGVNSETSTVFLTRRCRDGRQM